MAALQSMKTLAIQTMRVSGVSALVLGSAWRRRRLLILGYHGISLDDEHLWNPGLYMPPDLLRRRLDALRRSRANVLPLGEALESLWKGSLPPRSVVITFDDGSYDFYRQACPLLAEFGFPATAYVSTYYVDFNRPVYNTMVSYLLWKGLGRRLEWPEVLAAPRVLAPESLAETVCAFRAHATARAFSAPEKDALLAELAGRLDLDYERFCERRVLCLMNPSELREVAKMGMDVELHTHRHRSYRKRELFVAELEENRARILAATGRRAEHFCYPSGASLPVFAEWLSACGVRSGTTSVPGLASRASNRWFLPRLLDASNIPDAVFAAWVSGVGAWLPPRTVESSERFLFDG
jgi:peptidoglycan/xylan/chitin deacetylase (PgdA/CDA1 family)